MPTSEPAETPPPAPRLERVEGRGHVLVTGVSGTTRLSTLFQEGSAKIRLPRTHAASAEAVLINTAGGLTGGDRLDWRIEARDGAMLTATTQACERIYRSAGGDAEVHTHLRVGNRAHVDWLPQETILFDGARLNRTIDIELAPNATLTALEAIILGREAMGESARTALLRDRWTVSRNGTLVHAEANRLTGDDLERDAISLLDGANAFATLLYVGADAEQLAAGIDNAANDNARFAKSLIGERLVIRALGKSGLALRRLMIPVISRLARAGSLPRLWRL